MVLFLPVANVELNMPRLSLEKRRQIVDLVKDGNTYASISRRVPCSLWRRVIERAWQKVSLKTINSLHKGIKGRLMAVAEAEGEWVKHHK